MWENILALWDEIQRIFSFNTLSLGIILTGTTIMIAGLLGWWLQLQQKREDDSIFMAKLSSPGLDTLAHMDLLVRRIRVTHH